MEEGGGGHPCGRMGGQGLRAWEERAHRGSVEPTELGRQRRLSP